MTFGKWLCKSHLGSSFLTCKDPFLYSVFSNYFSPKAWAPVRSVWGQVRPWVLGMQRTEEHVVCQSTHQEPQVQSRPVASPLIRVQVRLVTYSPQGKQSQRAGDPASYPTSARAAGWEAGKGRNRDVRNLPGPCHLLDMGQREVKVLSSLIPFVCPRSSWEELNPQANVSVSSVRADSGFHPSLLITRAGWLLSPLHRWGCWNTKWRGWRVSPSRGLNPALSLTHFPRSRG